MEQYDCFTIDISIQNSKPFIEANKIKIFSLPRSRWYSMGRPKVMQADPFLFVNNGTLYLFYEEMCLGFGHGVIKMVSTKDLKTFTFPKLILSNPNCHFSYPYVFEENGEIYMMPETGCDHNIRLYKSQNGDLSNFQLHKVILERDNKDWNEIKFDYADSCIYKKDSLYYLFTSYCDAKQYHLELYVSDKLDSGYKKHPMSPICSGNKYGRCGGSLIEVDGKLYRPAQDCVNQYGGQMHILEILELSPTAYIEHPVKDNVLPQQLTLYKEGGHQINFADFLGHIVIATDVKYHCSFFLERLKLMIQRFFHLV